MCMLYIEFLNKEMQTYKLILQLQAIANDQSIDNLHSIKLAMSNVNRGLLKAD